MSGLSKVFGDGLIIRVKLTIALGIDDKVAILFDVLKKTPHVQPNWKTDNVQQTDHWLAHVFFPCGSEERLMQGP